MKKTILFLIVLTVCLGALLLFTRTRVVRATGTVTRYVGDVAGHYNTVINGPPNSTGYYNVTESNPGLVVYSLTQNGTYSNSLTVPFTLDAYGNSATLTFYSKAVAPGQTTETICSPQVGCASNSPTDYIVYTPATGVAKIQYQKDGVFVDVPSPLNVVKGDMVTFKALPSPTGSHFYVNDPTWSGASGATGAGDTTTVTFTTLSKNTHDYKTVIATVRNGGGSYTANVIVGDGVTSVTLQPVDPATLWSDNPNTGAGKRIYPDKNSPSDTVNRKKVRVTAPTTFGSGKTIYFKSFDLDDPSTDVAPVDSNGSLGNDNRGGSGTAAQYGILSSVGGNGTTNTVSATTDANGVASADLTVTMQPGDNFMVAASHDSTYLNGLTVNGITLKDSSGNPVGPSTSKAKESSMLTVWRRVHVEVDSMGIVPTIGTQKNHVEGKITLVNGTSTIATIVGVDQSLDDGSPRLDNPSNSGDGRFQKGTIRIGTTGNVTATTDLQGNGSNYVQKNDGNGIVIPCTVSKSGETDVTGNVISLLSNVVKLSVTGGTLTTNFVGGIITIGGVSMTITAVNDADSSVTVNALADIPVQLVDDDDFNSNDAGNLRGDEGEDVVALTQTFSRMQESDDPTANVYAPAYIRPVYDGAGNTSNNTSNISFSLNVTQNPAAIENQTNLGRNSGGNESDNFWVVYLQIGYQGDLTQDCDPYTEGSTGGITVQYGVVDDVTNSSGVPQGGQGSHVYVEASRDGDLAFMLGDDLKVRTAPHEVGHQFGLKGDALGFGLMSQSGSGEPLSLVDRHLNILRWRVKSPGQP